MYHRLQRIFAFKCLLYVNNLLVAAALPQKLYILEAGYEFTVHQNINILHNREFIYFLPQISGIEPYCLIRIFLSYLSGKFKNIIPVGPMKGIPA